MIQRGEAVVANAVVHVQSDGGGGSGSGGRMRVLVTNLPRMLLLDATGPCDADSDESPVYALKEQLEWTEATHPAVKHVRLCPVLSRSQR